jgi:ABC-type lipoprotein release transport system permease subunit
MGLTRLGAVGLFVAEAAAIAVIGGIAGVAAGLGPSLLLQKYGVRIGEETTARIALPISETMHGKLTPEVVLGAFALGVAMAILGSVPAALRAASIQPVAAMKSGR